MRHDFRLKRSHRGGHPRVNLSARGLWALLLLLAPTACSWEPGPADTEDAAVEMPPLDADGGGAPLVDAGGADAATPVLDGGHVGGPAAGDGGRPASTDGGEAVTPVPSCTFPPVPTVGPTGVGLATGVTYATMDGQPQALDIAWPNRAGIHPLVVWIHGGGWSSGDRTGGRNTILRLAGQGYVAASIDYRLANAQCASCKHNLFPAAVEDVRCAIRWLKLNASQYGIDSSRVGVVGVSAGGHLAAMLGTASSASGLDGPCAYPGSPAVQAVVAYCPPTDLRVGEVLQTAVENFLGGTVASLPEKAAFASPVTYAHAGAAPLLLLHGTADSTVSVNQSRRLHAAVRGAGAPATLIEEAGGEHVQPQPFSSSYPTATCTTWAFLKERLKP